MAKKITIFDREKLRKARERGLTDSEIKAQFGITDDRTLKRHLKLAEQEQEARYARMEILKDAIKDHLAELRQLIENWKAGIRIQPVTVLPRVMANSITFTQSNRLYSSLKGHLPIPTFWRQYGEWENKYKLYIANCEKLQEEIRRGALTGLKLDFASDDTSNLSHLTSGLRDWILGYVQDKFEGEDMREVKFRWKDLTISLEGGALLEGKQMFSHPKGIELLEIFNQHDVDTEFYEKGCRALLGFCLSSGTVANLSTLFVDLNALEPKIHNSLEEILLRRDYILYTCNRCPGKPKLLR
ncbi:hypothetical protein ES706_02042 [subsurface metagenome]|nr:hypothetical protein [Dehalococcoidia bacterium]